MLGHSSSKEKHKHLNVQCKLTMITFLWMNSIKRVFCNNEHIQDNNTIKIQDINCTQYCISAWVGMEVQATD